jgi:hypothetical protein
MNVTTLSKIGRIIKGCGLTNSLDSLSIRICFTSNSQSLEWGGVTTLSLIGRIMKGCSFSSNLDNISNRIFFTGASEFWERTSILIMNACPFRISHS